MIVVLALLFHALFVELKVVTFKDFILVKRERVFDSDILDVFVCLVLLYLLKTRIVHENRLLAHHVVFSNVLGLSNKLV